MECNCWSCLLEGGSLPTKKRTVAKKTAAAKKQPAKHVMIRTSERTAFRRCRQKWYWAWRQGLRPPFAANALWFGEGVHVALAAWYKQGTKRGPHPAETFDAWVGSERRRIFTQPNPSVDDTEIVDAKELGMAMLNHYVNHYDKDEQFNFIITEQPFQRMVATGGAFMGQPFFKDTEYCGTFDGVFRDTEGVYGTPGKPWLIEHKTAKSISTLHLPLDDQAGSYWAVATDTLRRLKMIKPTEELEGILYNFLRKAMPDDRPTNAEGMRLNKDGSVSKSQPAPYFVREPVFRYPQERSVQLQRIKDESHEMQLVRAGILPVTKNPTKDCAYDCPFLNMCQLHEANDDWQDFRDAVFIVEDPYAAHRRKSAAE